MSDFVQLPIYFQNFDTVKPHLIARSAIMSVGPNLEYDSRTIVILVSRVELHVCLTYEQMTKLLGHKQPTSKGKKNVA